MILINTSTPLDVVKEYFISMNKQNTTKQIKDNQLFIDGELITLEIGTAIPVKSNLLKSDIDSRNKLSINYIIPCEIIDIKTDSCGSVLYRLFPAGSYTRRPWIHISDIHDTFSEERRIKETKCKIPSRYNSTGFQFSTQVTEILDGEDICDIGAYDDEDDIASEECIGESPVGAQNEYSIQGDYYRTISFSELAHPASLYPGSGQTISSNRNGRIYSTSSVFDNTREYTVDVVASPSVSTINILTTINSDGI